MESRVNFAIVGVFVLALGSALVGFTVWLGFADRRAEMVTYVIHVQESVSGLNERAPVKYRGVDVGTVRRITLDADDPSRVRVLLDIVPDTPIKTDTVATLATQGLTGIAHIELSGGSRDSPPLTAERFDGYPEITTTPSLLVRLDEAISFLLAEMSETTSSLKSVAEHVGTLLNAHDVAATAEILENVRRMTASLTSHTEGLAAAVEHITTVTGESARVSQELPELVEGLRGALGALERTAGAIASTAGDVGALAIDARKEIQDATRGVVPSVSSALEEIRQLAATLNRVGQELERNPSMLLRGRGARAPGPGE